MNVRIELARLLRLEVPTGWTVLEYGTALDNPQKPVVMVRQQGVKRTPGAPRLYRDAEFNVALIEPGLDPALVEDALDKDVELLLDALEAIAMDGLVWMGATRALFDTRFHGYDVNLIITTEKD